MYRLIIAGIGVIAAAVLALGCGGGGGDQATAQAGKAEFMKQAHAVCAKTQKGVAVALRESGKGKVDVFKRSSVLLNEEADELTKIAPPGAVAAEIKPLVEKIKAASVVFAHASEQGLDNARLAAYKREARRLHLEGC